MAALTRLGMRRGAKAHGGPATRRWGTRFLGPVLIAAMLVTLLAPWTGTAAAQPSPGDSFSYTYHHYVTNGGGEYEDWTENTRSRGE